MQLTILRNPNPFTFGITLPFKTPEQVPSGIQNPEEFKEVGAYLHALLVTEVKHDIDPTGKTGLSFLRKVFGA